MLRQNVEKYSMIDKSLKWNREKRNELERNRTKPDHSNIICYHSISEEFLLLIKNLKKILRKNPKTNPCNSYLKLNRFRAFYYLHQGWSIVEWFIVYTLCSFSRHTESIRISSVQISHALFSINLKNDSMLINKKKLFDLFVLTYKIKPMKKHSLSSNSSHGLYQSHAKIHQMGSA